MSKVLIVYGTGTGCTTGIAEKIAQSFMTQGAQVDIRPASDKPDPTGYDAVVVGSGVRAGQWHGAVRDWVSANAEVLKRTPVALFTVCLTMASNPEKSDEVRAYTDPLLAAAGLTPVDIGLFAGWNEPKAFSLPERLIMKIMKAPQGDFRDMEAVAAWTLTANSKLGLAG